MPTSARSSAPSALLAPRTSLPAPAQTAAASSFVAQPALPDETERPAGARLVHMRRRWAGVCGPTAFGAASAAAARRQASYSHRSHHVSGLAAKGQASASIMVPGFMALSAAQSVLPAPSPALQRLARAAAVTTLVAGVVQVSDPRCPQPGFDADATASDLGHGAASIATFVLWTAMPIVAARDDQLPAGYRRTARAFIAPTVTTFVLAGVTTRLDSPIKGAAQRAFLTSVFAFMAATGSAASAR